MKAIVVSQFGEPYVLRFQEVPDLVPQDKEVLIEVKAIGVNPVDAYIRSGLYASKPSLPYTPGFDAAGIIQFVGKKIKDFKRGDRVYTAGTVTGAYAEKALCLESHIFPLPKNITFEQGAALGVPYATAHRALFGKANVKPHETVLIHGASGGVGLAALQLAKKFQLIVIATAGTENGCRLLKSQGADCVLNHNQRGYLEEVMPFTKQKGVAVILEMLADVNLGNDLPLLAYGGRVVVIGSRGVVSINPRDLMCKESSISGMTILNVTDSEKKEIHREIAKGLKDGSLVPVISESFKLEEAPLAHEAVMQKGALGKIVLLP